MQWGLYKNVCSPDEANSDFVGIMHIDIDVIICREKMFIFGLKCVFTLLTIVRLKLFVLCIVDIYICAYPNFIVVRYLLFVAAITVCCMIYCLFHDVNLRLRWSDTHCNPADVITGILL